MGVRLPSEQELPPVPWATINLGEGQTLEIATRRPTFREMNAAASEPDGIAERVYRMRVSITDWRGVTDAQDQPVPFSWDALVHLCGIYPQAVPQINVAVRDVWVTLPGDLAKNWQTPPINGGTTTTDETTNTTASLDYASPSSDAPNSGPPTATE